MFIGGVAKLIGLAGTLIEKSESGDATRHGMTLHIIALSSESGRPVADVGDRRRLASGGALQCVRCPLALQV